MNLYAPRSFSRAIVRAAMQAARNVAASDPDTAGITLRVRRHSFCFAPNAFTYGRVRIFNAFRGALYPH